MYLRCTPALAIAGVLTCALLLWITADVANNDISPNVFSNALTVGVGASWLHWANSRRSERATRGAIDHEADATIRQLR